MAAARGRHLEVGIVVHGDEVEQSTFSSHLRRVPVDDRDKPRRRKVVHPPVGRSLQRFRHVLVLVAALKVHHEPTDYLDLFVSEVDADAPAANTACPSPDDAQIPESPAGSTANTG
jgi:hypothetical protein